MTHNQPIKPAQSEMRNTCINPVGQQLVDEHRARFAADISGSPWTQKSELVTRKVDGGSVWRVE